MTLDNIRDHIWYATGEKTSWDPDNDTSWDGGSYLTWVANEAQRAVAKWKDPQTGRILRIRSLVSELYFYSYAYSSSVDSAECDSWGSTGPYIVSSDLASAFNSDDQLNGWIVEMTSGDTSGQLALIVDYTASTGTIRLHEEFTTDPSASDTFRVYKNFWYLIPSSHSWNVNNAHIILPSETDTVRATGNLLEVLKVIDLGSSTELKRASRPEAFVNNIVTAGSPTQWYRSGNKLYMDYAVDFDDGDDEDELRTFKLEYYRMPTEMSLAADEPEIPEIFHMAMVLWGMWWCYKVTGESSKAYSTKLDFNEEMRKIKSQYDIAEERSNSKGVIIFND